MTTPDPATRTRISATHSSSWRGLRLGIICLRSGVICPILGARGKRSLFKSPSSHHAQRDRSRNWSIKTAICVVSLRVFSCRRARVMSLMKHSSRVCHRGDWMGTCARRGLRSRSDIVLKSLLRHDYVRNGSKCTALTGFHKHESQFPSWLGMGPRAQACGISTPHFASDPLRVVGALGVSTITS